MTQKFAEYQPDLKRSVKNLYITRNRNTNDVLYASFNKHNAIKKMNELWEQIPNFKQQFNSLETSAFEVYSHSLETPKMILEKLEEENTNFTDLCEPIAECAAEHSEAFKMLVIPPNQHPYEAYIYDSLDAWQVMVDGDIECTYPFNDGTFLVGNGNARINGLEGNRTINGNIYAGTILLAADNGEGGVQNLSEAQVLKHKQKLWEPENISPESVKNYSMKFYSFPDSPNQNQFFEITM